jgi:hypothetical protein
MRSHVPRGAWAKAGQTSSLGRELQLELPALEYRDHAAELVPGDLATIDDDPWHTMIAIDGAAEDQAIVHVRPAVSRIEAAGSLLKRQGGSCRMASQCSRVAGIRLSRLSLDLVADVLSGDSEAQRPTVPFQPVQRDVVADRGVADQVRAASVQQVHGGRQRCAQLVPPGRGRRAGNGSRRDHGSTSRKVACTDRKLQ